VCVCVCVYVCVCACACACPWAYKTSCRTDMCVPACPPLHPLHRPSVPWGLIFSSILAPWRALPSKPAMFAQALVFATALMPIVLLQLTLMAKGGPLRPKGLRTMRQPTHAKPTPAPLLMMGRRNHEGCMDR